MADSPRTRVRPTIRFLRDLGLSFPRLDEPLWRIPHLTMDLAERRLEWLTGASLHGLDFDY
jgi:hypothetical protein